MPYAVKKLSNGQHATIVKATGKIVGRHSSAKKARAQIAAIYANSQEPQRAK